MANLVEANNIAGLKVYGQQQVDYTVEGKAGACIHAGLHRRV